MGAKKVESKAIVKALQKSKGNQAVAARACGITRQAIRTRIKKDPIVKNEWKKYVESLRRTIPNKRSIKVISEAMEAETVKSVRVEGGEFGEREEVTEPDHYARLKANEQFLKITRLLGDDSDKKAAEQHLHLHLGDKKTSDLLAEIKSQLKFLGHDMDAEALPPAIESV